MINAVLTYLKARVPKKGSFTFNVFTLMSATTFAHVLGAAVVPILTRLYTPEHFGNLAIFMAITGITGMLACGRYERAIMLPKDHEDAVNVLALSSLIVLLISGLVFILIIVFQDTIATLLIIPGVSSWLWMIPFFTLFKGLNLIFDQWNTRMMYFRTLAQARVISSIISASSLIGIGIYYPSAKGLIIGHLTGLTCAIGYLCHHIIRKNFRLVERYISKKNIINQCRIYYQFPLYDSWAVLLNYGYAKLPLLILNHFFNNIIVGYYFIGYKILHLPLVYINNSFSIVFYQKYEEKKNSYGKKDFLKKVLKKTTIISFFPSVLLLLFAPTIFKIFLGEQWLIAGKYVQYLAPVIFFRFVADSVSTVFWSEHKNYLRLIFNAGFFIVSTSAFIVGGLMNNIYLTFIIYSLCISLLYLLQIIMTMKAASN